MKILQSGVAKSGNYWLWKILDETLKYSNNEVKKFVTSTEEYDDILNSKKLSNIDQISSDVIDVDMTGYYWRISSYYKEKIPDLDSYIDQSTHIWTHSEFCNSFNELQQKVDKIIYIVRDPRDVAISMANFAFTNYAKEAYPHHEKNVNDYIDKRIKWQTMTWNRHVSGWLSNDFDNMHIIFYENLKSDFDEEYKKLIEFLNIELTDNDFKEIKNKVSADSMRKDSPGHVRKPSKKDWRSKLTDDQLKSANSVCLDLLTLLGYQAERSLDNTQKPNFESNYNEIKKLYIKSNLSFKDNIDGFRNLLLSKRSLKDKMDVIRRKIISSLQVFLRKQ